MNIPTWIYNIFNEADSCCKDKRSYNFNAAKHDGVLDKSEVDFAMKHISIFSSGQLKINTGMTVYDMIDANRSYLRKYIIMGDNEYKAGRKVSVCGIMFPAIFSRKKSKDDPKSIEVMQGQYAVKTYSKDNPSIQTCNVCNCIAVTIYDKKNKRGFVAHIDTTEKADSLKSVLQKLNFDPKNCEVRIIGGITGLSEGNIEIIDTTLKSMGFDIEEYDILGSADKPRAIQLNLETGEVTDYEESNPLNNRDIDEVAGDIGKSPLAANKRSD